ncbi:hypothetical protein Celaphus_00018257, partial [Cervus elaphus hippelaphus]
MRKNPEKASFFAHSLRATHHPKSSEHAYTSLQAALQSPQRPRGPPRVSAAGLGDALLQPRVLSGLRAACEPRQSGKLHVLESDGESVHRVLTGQAEETEATAAVHGLLQLTSQLFSTSGSSAGRDESLLDRFLIGLDQQLEELDTPACSLGCELPASRGNLESFTRWSQMERVSI